MTSHDATRHRTRNACPGTFRGGDPRCLYCRDYRRCCTASVVAELTKDGPKLQEATAKA